MSRFSNNMMVIKIDTTIMSSQCFAGKKVNRIMFEICKTIYPQKKEIEIWFYYKIP